MNALSNTLNEHIIVSQQVKDALEERKPVIALETHGIVHGIPYPRNEQLVQEIIQYTKKIGCIPAFIAMIHGKIKVGLDLPDLKFLTGHVEAFSKANRRELFLCCLQGKSAALTVSAGVYVAHQVGIPIFSTGGIGGVHHGAEESFDISNDIYEIAHTPVTVICGGPKIILDLPKTMEMLETYGVPVLGFDTALLPTFLSRQSNLKVNYRIHDEQEAAQLIQLHRDFNYQSGMIIANPIPEAYSIPFREAQAMLTKALAKAKEQGVSGKGVTIFLLKEMNLLSQNDLILSIIHLISNNVQLAARISVALAK